MLPALITKLVTVNRGGYTVLDSVLPNSVDKVSAQYQSRNGQSGYVKFTNGRLIQWGGYLWSIREMARP